MEVIRTGDRPEIDGERRKSVGYFMDATIESSGDLRGAPAVISCAQRLRALAGIDRYHGESLAALGPRHELFEERLVDLRHIAGENQIPFRVTLREGRMYAGQWSATRENIFDNGITKVSIPANFSDQRYLIDRSASLACNEFHEPAAMKWQESLVAAHPQTTAASQHEARAFHAEMITLEGSGRTYLSDRELKH